MQAVKAARGSECVTVQKKRSAPLGTAATSPVLTATPAEQPYTGPVGFDCDKCGDKQLWATG
ncbi:hypothetical protein [Streptomyces sp. NPDC017095]|uniref:hypothetical protein n=1 Tax=Streptomyces sp. NPDC017095 TaxID=3364977 RepID=UPI003787CC32